MSDKKPTIPNLSQTVLKHPVHFLAFGFGSGLAPFAPGTFGTLVAIPLYLLLAQLSLPLYLVLVVAVCVVGVWLCGKSSELLGVHDHSGIVWDEIAGLLITLILVPVGWQWIAIGFVLFRLFDIWKPWPISLLDKKVQGGFGIMIDDIIAGIYALICIQLLHYFVPTL